MGPMCLVLTDGARVTRDGSLAGNILDPVTRQCTDRRRIHFCNNMVVHSILGEPFPDSGIDGSLDAFVGTAPLGTVGSSSTILAHPTTSFQIIEFALCSELSSQLFGP